MAQQSSTDFVASVATRLHLTGTQRGRDCAMPNFYEYNQEQGYSLPPSVREVLGEKHLCFFIHQAVERLGLREFVQEYREEGHPNFRSLRSRVPGPRRP